MNNSNTARRLVEAGADTAHTPTAVDWAAFLVRYPEEHARLEAVDRTGYVEPPLHAPSGALATSGRWARYFAEHRDDMARLAALKPPAPPSGPIECIRADGKRGWKW